ncbi:DUF1189 family protein [Sporosarcina sp. FA9]|uniref:DUF1189 family protein n=1 Tax=Sporosarcina sp. FA9 TaxID=3413030 RepID=UPI003F655A57
MKIHNIFSASFFEPKKLAAFRLLSIGKVFRYVYIFIFIFTIISFSRFFVGDTTLFEGSPDLMEYSKRIGWLIYPIAFMMQLVINTFYVFIRISVFAYIGSLLLKLMKRRGEFLHIWRTSAIAITVPILFAIFFDFFPILANYSFLFTSIIHIVYIALAIQYYPKKPR